MNDAFKSNQVPVSGADPTSSWILPKNRYNSLEQF
jgi:hypothetical protein